MTTSVRHVQYLSELSEPKRLKVDLATLGASSPKSSQIDSHAFWRVNRPRAKAPERALNVYYGTSMLASSPIFSFAARCQYCSRLEGKIACRAWELGFDEPRGSEEAPENVQHHSDHFPRTTTRQFLKLACMPRHASPQLTYV